MSYELTINMKYVAPLLLGDVKNFLILARIEHFMNLSMSCRKVLRLLPCNLAKWNRDIIVLNNVHHRMTVHWRHGIETIANAFSLFKSISDTFIAYAHNCHGWFSKRNILYAPCSK